jgi:hypothetical protein
VDCDKCNGIIFEEIFYHEYGCPNAIIDNLVLCNNCGTGFECWTPEADVCPECWHKGFIIGFSVN